MEQLSGDYEQLTKDLYSFITDKLRLLDEQLHIALDDPLKDDPMYAFLVEVLTARVRAYTEVMEHLDGLTGLGPQES